MTKGLDANSKLALEMYERAQAAKARGEAQDIGTSVAPMRVRLASQVDLTKAKSNCKRCHGTGISHYKVEGDQRIPAVCSCVVKAGGVAEDKLDRFMRGEHDAKAMPH